MRCKHRQFSLISLGESDPDPWKLNWYPNPHSPAALSLMKRSAEPAARFPAIGSPLTVRAGNVFVGSVRGEDYAFCPGCGYATEDLHRCKNCNHEQFISPESEETYCLNCGEVFG
jgi:hypothetical protein